jgi:hypothetical protein
MFFFKYPYTITDYLGDIDKCNQQCKLSYLFYNFLRHTSAGDRVCRALVDIGTATASSENRSEKPFKTRAVIKRFFGPVRADSMENRKVDSEGGQVLEMFQK